MLNNGFGTMLKSEVDKYGAAGLKRGEAPFEEILPSPLVKGRGIKGEGLDEYL